MPHPSCLVIWSILTRDLHLLLNDAFFIRHAAIFMFHILWHCEISWFVLYMMYYMLQDLCIVLQSLRRR